MNRRALTGRLLSALDPPTFQHWPSAVRSAELLRGSVVRCGPGLRSAAWPDTPSVRAAALDLWFRSRHAATHLTAAWILGAARDPGNRLDFTRLQGSAQGATWNPADARIHDFRLAPGDTMVLSGRAVTTPSRTVYDLLRSELFGAHERIACRVLLAFNDGARASLVERLNTHQRPHNLRVRNRLLQL